MTPPRQSRDVGDNSLPRRLVCANSNFPRHFFTAQRVREAPRRVTRPHGTEVQRRFSSPRRGASYPDERAASLLARASSIAGEAEGCAQGVQQTHLSGHSAALEVNLVVASALRAEAQWDVSTLRRLPLTQLHDDRRQIPHQDPSRLCGRPGWVYHLQKN